jgi:uncharacterized protein
MANDGAAVNAATSAVGAAEGAAASADAPNDALANTLLAAMVSYNAGDARRINHAVKVFAYARHIALSELYAGRIALETLLAVDCASILHDIGIHEAERKHGSSAGNWQELEGPPIARAMLSDAGVEARVAERALFIIGHHHSYGMIDGIDFQIVVEADFIVNIDEDRMGADAIAAVRKNIFRTPSGIALLDSLFPGSPANDSIINP